MRLCHLMCPTARTFWKDDEYFARLQLLVGGSYCLAVTLAALDRKGSQEAHKPTYFAVESLFLRHVDRFAWQIGGNKRHISPRKMIRRNDEWTFGWYILTSLQVDTQNSKEEEARKPAYCLPAYSWRAVGFVEILFARCLRQRVRIRWWWGHPRPRQGGCAPCTP